MQSEQTTPAELSENGIRFVSQNSLSASDLDENKILVASQKNAETSCSVPGCLAVDSSTQLLAKLRLQACVTCAWPGVTIRSRLGRISLMADEQPTTRQITGDDIISELLRNCEAGAFKIRFTTILPSVYHVYLHPSDYDLIRPVVSAVTAEARSALIDKLEELTAASKPSGIARTLGFDSGKQMEYKILDPDWSIDFHPDTEEKLAPGDIEIYSELASAARPEFEGAMTRHVTKRQAGGESTSSRTTAPASGSATATIGRTAYAVIRYQENGTSQTFDVTKNQIVIGRGGKSFWVDLKLSAPPDVSREHCRIRRDETTGKFFIKDVSQYGTSVDGQRIPSSAPDANGDHRDKNLEAPLPANCRITLADVFDLGFEAVEAS